MTADPTTPPLLATKLFRPAPRPGQVARPRLGTRLDRGLTASLVLVSAPAGFGKTTVLSQWLADVEGRGLAPAWLALDQHDNDPATFWTYVVAALRTVTPGIGESSLALLRDGQAPPVRLLLTTLVNELDAGADDTVLVLDDYHAIESPEIHEGVGFLLEHLPPRLHLVIAGRADPALPLAGLRARGELVEVRAADLRFTGDEAAAYLNGAMSLDLTRADVAALEARTEGWVAALQLAALSLDGRADASGFIAGFAGDDRYVVDYLVEEVLNRQPPHVQDFLFATSVLDRMTGALCDALTGQGDGRATLEVLDKRNLFLVPLDDRRQWYRYHHLFADVLQARLLDERPDRVPALHRAAADWCAEHGQIAEAVEHAMSGGDFARAAELVEPELAVLRRDRREVTLRAWLERLPADVLRARPVLCNGLAGTRMSTGTIDGVDALLDDAQRWLDEMAASGDGSVPQGMSFSDDEELRRLPAGVAVHRAGLALARGDLDGAVAHARRALATVVPEDHLARGAAFALRGLAAWATGDLEVAQASYEQCLPEFERIGHLGDYLGCSIALADMQLARGRLRDARTTFERALALVARHGGTPRGTADMHTGLGALHCELGDLDAARRELGRSEELGELGSLPQNPYRLRVALARVAEAEGDLDSAAALLDEAARVYVGDFSPEVRPVPALRARLWLAQGRVDDALAWVAQRMLSATDELGYLRECEHVTLARVLMARPETLDRAVDLLQRLDRAAEEGGRLGSLVEIRAALAVAQHLRGDEAGALAVLGSALDLAEPEGYVRVLVEHGAPMTELLSAVRGDHAAYAQRLLNSVGEALEAPAPGPDGGLVDPLSERERAVLRLLASDLSGPEIARELVVSLNTVRSHTKAVYAKLGVNSRRTAVRRASELGLLSR